MSQKPAFILEKIDGVDVGEMLRTTRSEVPKGTRIANVCTVVAFRSRFQRVHVESLNRIKVFDAWEAKWGPLDTAQYHEVRHVHLTCQVLTELLVYPEGV